MHFHLFALNCRYSHSCLALFYVRNELEKHLSCQVSLNQLTINDPYFDTLLTISASPASHLMFSVYIWNADFVSRLIHDLATTQPERPIIIGGPQAGCLKKLPQTCTVVEGEIEGVSDQFYSDLTNGTLTSTYTGTNGSQFVSPYRPEDFADHLQNRNIYYESSRGCPFSCAYCLSSISRGITALELNQVCQELENIVLQQPKLVKFVDRTFNADSARTIAIWQHILTLPGTTSFHFEIAPDLFSEEMFQLLENVPPGKFQFEIGIQSINKETLLCVNRTMDLAKTKQNLSRLLALNSIHLHIDLILGLPHETPQSFAQAIEFIFSLNPHYVQMGLLKVLPHTPMSKKKEDYGLKFCKNPPYQVLETHWLSHEKICSLYELGECIEAFFNNRYFRQFFTFLHLQQKNFFDFFEGLLLFCKKNQFFQRAKTQTFLNKLLISFLQEKNQQVSLYTELLIFDWLSCGHRQLPEELYSGSLNDIRSTVWQSMPENVSGLYNHTERNMFFKQGVFFLFSGEFLYQTGLDEKKGGSRYICFLPNIQRGVFKRSEMVVLNSLD